MGIARPTLLLGREHEYHTAHELEELRRAIDNTHTVRVPPICLGYLRIVRDHRKGILSVKGARERLAALFASDQQWANVVDYCSRQNWLREGWTGEVELSEAGVSAIENEDIYVGLGGDQRNWARTSDAERRVLVQEAINARPKGGVLGVARVVASTFQPAASVGTVRSWILRNGLDTRIRAANAAWFTKKRACGIATEPPQHPPKPGRSRR